MDIFFVLLFFFISINIEILIFASFRWILWKVEFVFLYYLCN